jgi:hypothetical protein
VGADKSELRSDSEGEIDEESHIKITFPRSFHRYERFFLNQFTVQYSKLNLNMAYIKSIIY